MTVQRDCNSVLQLVKMLEERQIFHQRCGGKSEKAQVIDSKKLFQPIVCVLATTLDVRLLD